MLNYIVASEFKTIVETDEELVKMFRLWGGFSKVAMVMWWKRQCGHDQILHSLYVVIMKIFVSFQTYSAQLNARYEGYISIFHFKVIIKEIMFFLCRLDKPQGTTLRWTCPKRTAMNAATYFKKYKCKNNLSKSFPVNQKTLDVLETFRHWRCSNTSFYSKLVSMYSMLHGCKNQLLWLRVNAFIFPSTDQSKTHSCSKFETKWHAQKQSCQWWKPIRRFFGSSTNHVNEYLHMHIGSQAGTVAISHT